MGESGNEVDHEAVLLHDTMKIQLLLPSTVVDASVGRIQGQDGGAGDDASAVVVVDSKDVEVPVDDVVAFAIAAIAPSCPLLYYVSSS